MGDLRSRIEVTKLARELGVEETEIAFLAASAAEDLRDLRGLISTALFARHESRVRLLAALSRRLPVPLTAKIAETALGPALSARIAGALEPEEAARLAEHLSASFLTDLAIALDPARVAPIVQVLPGDLVADVGRRLLAAGEHIALARFVTVVAPDVAMAVVEDASGADVLQVVLFADDASALDALVRRAPDVMLADVLRAVAEQDAWPAVLPAFSTLEPEVMRSLVNVPATLDAGTIDRVVGHARDLDAAPVLVDLLLAMDDAHLEALRGSALLRDPGVQEWLTSHAAVSEHVVVPVLESLGLR